MAARRNDAQVYGSDICLARCVQVRARVVSHLSPPPVRLDCLYLALHLGEPFFLSWSLIAHTESTIFSSESHDPASLCRSFVPQMDVRKHLFRPAVSLRMSQPGVILQLAANLPCFESGPSDISLDKLVGNSLVTSYSLCSDLPLSSLEVFSNLSRGTTNALAKVPRQFSRALEQVM